MARTQRDISKHIWRKPSGTQAERRSYYAALDQEAPVRVRGARKPQHLPDDRSELWVASERETLRVTRWLAQQVGRPWAQVQKAAQTFPSFKRTPTAKIFVRDCLAGAVETQVLIREGQVQCLVDGIVRALYKPFYVHPVSGLLCKLK